MGCGSGLGQLAIAGLALAFPSPARPLDVPRCAGRVTDLAGMLEAERRVRISERLAQADLQSGVQLFVLTLPTLAGEPLEEFSVRVARQWRIGHDGRDDGVLLLVVRDDRRLRLEVGYGLEATLTDLESARILDGGVAPLLRSGAAGEAVESGVEAVLAHLGVAPAVAASAKAPAGLASKLAACLLGGALLLFITVRLLAAPGAGPWIVFPIFVLPLWAFFAALVPRDRQSAVALGIVVPVAILFAAGRLFVRHSRAGRRWANGSRLARALGATAEAERSAAHDGLDSWKSRQSSSRESGWSGDGGDFGGGGASSRW